MGCRVERGMYFQVSLCSSKQRNNTSSSHPYTKEFTLVSSPNNWNQKIIEEFRANGGKVGGPFADATMLLLHTRGAKSNQPRVNPLVYTTDGEHLVIIASKGGAPTNPDWYYNLLAHPNVEVEVGTERFPVRATVAEGQERDRLFNQMVAQRPGFADYQKNTTRRIPVVVLERTSAK